MAGGGERDWCSRPGQQSPRGTLNLKKKMILCPNNFELLKTHTVIV